MNDTEAKNDQNKAVKVTRTDQTKVPMGVLDGSVSSDWQQCALACLDGVYLLNAKDKQHQRLYQHDSWVSSVHWVAEDLIVSAGYDGAIQWFNPQTKQPIDRLKLHQFWSWDMALSPDRTVLASVTGQYLAGGYKYEPQSESEPSVCLVSVKDRKVLHRLSQTPSVQAVAFSPDGRFVAAGNLMGTVRVFDVASGKLAREFNTADFTSWGIIKSHCYLGGIFALRFTPDGQHLLLAGMGPMRDPMAGNGKQRWQKWKWDQAEPQRVDQIHDKEFGEGLMEALAIDSAGDRFLMAGRLRGGNWNAALFDGATGNQLTTLKTGYRVTQAAFSDDGKRLALFGAQGQGKRNKEGEHPHFGRIEFYDA